MTWRTELIRDHEAIVAFVGEVGQSRTSQFARCLLAYEKRVLRPYWRSRHRRILALKEWWWIMALTKHDTSKRQVATRRFDRFFDDWPEAFRRPVFFWPERAVDPMHVEEFTEDGALVVRAEIAGIDPEKDVDISVVGDTLHISAERREEEKTEGRDYARREFHYGAFRRDLPLPKGTSDFDVKATYKDGILEIRVPMPKELVETGKKIPVTAG